MVTKQNFNGLAKENKQEKSLIMQLFPDALRIFPVATVSVSKEL